MSKSFKTKILTLLIAVFIPSVVYFGIFSANQNALQGRLSLNSLYSSIPDDFYNEEQSFCPGYEMDFIEYINNKSQAKKIRLIDNLDEIAGFDIASLNLPDNVKNEDYKLSYNEIQKLWAIHTGRCNEEVINNDLLLPAIESELDNYESQLNTQIITPEKLMDYFRTVADPATDLPEEEVANGAKLFDNFIIKSNLRASCLINLSHNSDFGNDKNYQDDCLDQSTEINFNEKLELDFKFAEQNEVQFFSMVTGLDNTDIAVKDLITEDNFNETIKDNIPAGRNLSENFECENECENKNLIYISIIGDKTQLSNRETKIASEEEDDAPSIDTINKTYTNLTVYILAAKKGDSADNPSTSEISEDLLKNVDITCESNQLNIETTCAFQIPVNTRIPNGLKLFISNDRPIYLPNNSSRICEADSDNPRNIICERVKTYDQAGENKISFILNSRLIPSTNTIVLGSDNDSNKIEISRDSKVRQGEKQEIKVEFNHTKDLKFAKILVCNSEKCDGDYKTSIFSYCHEDFSRANKACNTIEESDEYYETPETERLTLETFNLAPDDYYIIVVTYDKDENRDSKTKHFTVRPARNRGTGLTQVSPIPTIPACSKYFVDMLPNDPLCLQATLLRERNIFMGQEINGQRYANLKQPINRAEFFAVSSRLYQLPNIPANPQNLARYNDLNPAMISDPNNNWWLSPLGQLSQAGIVTGYQDDSIRPFAEITQAELAKVTGLSLKLINPMSLNPQIKPWHLPVTQQLGAQGIIFNPDVKALRADAVHIISQSIIAAERTPTSAPYNQYQQEGL